MLASSQLSAAAFRTLARTSACTKGSPALSKQHGKSCNITCNLLTCNRLIRVILIKILLTCTRSKQIYTNINNIQRYHIWIIWKYSEERTNANEMQDQPCQNTRDIRVGCEWIQMDLNGFKVLECCALKRLTAHIVWHFIASHWAHSRW